LLPYHDDSHYLVLLLRFIYGWNSKSVAAGSISNSSQIGGQELQQEQQQQQQQQGE